MIIRDPVRLVGLIDTLPWYAETRPHQVKRLGFESAGVWAVGPTSEGRVRWLFEHQADMKEFKAQWSSYVLVAGYLGPLNLGNTTYKRLS